MYKVITFTNKDVSKWGGSAVWDNSPELAFISIEPTFATEYEAAEAVKNAVSVSEDCQHEMIFVDEFVEEDEYGHYETWMQFECTKCSCWTYFTEEEIEGRTYHL